MLKRICSILLCVSLLFSFGLTFSASETSTEVSNPEVNKPLTEEQTAALWEYLECLRFNDNDELSKAVSTAFKFDVKSAVLMEATTGTVLYEYQRDEKLSPASVTKVMTMLLIMEAIDSGLITTEDTVTASEHACSMGGTQIYLEVGEQMTVNDLLKAIAVPSANDAAVAMAEYIAGSEEEFVNRMNQKAKDLGMQHTNFTNCTGLFDDANHETTAYDIALMTKELVKYEKIYEYTKIWMDTLRNGEFGLSNTNKMLRTYSGMTGMKTGFTKISGYCFSGTAERDGMTLIVTIMGGTTSEARFSASAKLLDYGFASYAIAKGGEIELSSVKVRKGRVEIAEVEVVGELHAVVPKGQEKLVESTVTLTEEIEAPAPKGQQVGVVTYKIGDNTLQTCPIVLKEDVERCSIWDYFGRLICGLF